MLQREYADDDTVYQLKIKVSDHLLSGYCTHTVVHFLHSPGCNFIHSQITKLSVAYTTVTVFAFECGDILFCCCCRTYTKNTRIFVRRDQTGTVSTEPSASHISSPC